jgi:hypothetical protein
MFLFIRSALSCHPPRRVVAPALLAALLLAACAGPSSRHGTAAAAYRGAGRAGEAPASLPVFVDHTVGQEEISIQAMGLVGVPYRWGGNTPESGFDCSGLVRYVVARSTSVNLPRTTLEMSGRGRAIVPAEVAPGDLIFFNTTGRPHSHVGIYVGGYRFVNAPSTGGTVRLDTLRSAYWGRRFDGIRRVAAVHVSPTPFDAPRYEARAASPATSAADPVNPDITVSPQTAGIAARPDAAPAGRSASAGAAAFATGERRDDSQADASAHAGPDNPAPGDAFEPPPPEARAAQRQAASVDMPGPDVPSTPREAVVAVPAEDDPIARFAGAPTR